MKYTLDQFDELLKKSDEDFEAVLLQNKKILKARAENWTLLHRAVRQGVVDKVGLLLQHGADIHAEDESGYTPLHLAVHDSVIILERAKEKEEKMILKLAFAGADPERKSYLKKSSSRLNVFEFIQEQKKESDKEVGDHLDTIKEKIILARIVFLTEKVLAEYEKSHQGLFSSKIDPQRVAIINNIKTMLSEIKFNLETEQSIEKINSQTQRFLETLKNYEQESEEHHKKNGTLMFFGHGLTSSGLAKALHKVTSNTIVKQFSPTQKLSPKLEEISQQNTQPEIVSSVIVLAEEHEVKKPKSKITEIVDALEKEHHLNKEEIKEVQEILYRLEILDLFNADNIKIILATPTSELMRKFQAIFKWTETEPFTQDYKEPEESLALYKTVIVPECKNKCFELIWNHPDDVPSLSRGIQALYLSKTRTLVDSKGFVPIDTFQISYLTLLEKYPHGASEIGNYLYQIGNLIDIYVGNGKFITVDQPYVDARRLELEIALSKADKETQNDIFYFLSFHRRLNSHLKIKQEHLKYAKSLSMPLHFLMEDGNKEPKDQMFSNSEFQIMNDLLHQFPKHATILMEEVVAYLSMEEEADKTKDARIDKLKMFFTSLQEKLVLNRFNPKSENIKNLVFELERLFMVGVAENESQKNSFSAILEEFQKKLLEATRIAPLKEQCIRYIEANSFFNCQNPNQKLNLNQLPNELKQHFVPVTESKKAP